MAMALFFLYQQRVKQKKIALATPPRKKPPKPKFNLKIQKQWVKQKKIALTTALATPPRKKSPKPKFNLKIQKKIFNKRLKVWKRKKFFIDFTAILNFLTNSLSR